MCFQLTVHWRDKGQSQPKGEPARKMQFKVLDKNVNFFALGLSAAVL